MISSTDLRVTAAAYLQRSCPDQADLLSRAAAMIDLGETDTALAMALVACARKAEREDPAAARQMRDAALQLILIA